MELIVLTTLYRLYGANRTKKPYTDFMELIVLTTRRIMIQVVVIQQV